MATKKSPWTRWRIVATLLFSPFYVLYGACVLVRSIARLARGTRALRLSQAATIPCPNGHPNAARGRFECASCHAVYHGWVGACGLCGAGARWIACSTCGVAIPLPWERS